MAKKVRGRWQHEFGPFSEGFRGNAPSSGVRVTLTRRGVEISGWHDSYVGIEGGFVSWAEFDKARRAVLEATDA